MENFTNKISRLELENFTCFAKAEMDFSSGINVFIGENGTGKTHILKVLYATLSNPYDSYPLLSERYHEKFDEVFKTTISHLLRKKTLDGITLGYFSIRKSNKNFRFNFGLTANKNDEKDHTLYDFLKFDYKRGDIDPSEIDLFGEYSSLKELNSACLFIPCAEMLTFFDGFTDANKQSKNAFDETRDLANKLLDKPMKNEDLEEAQILVKEFESEVGIEVYKKDGQFYLKFKDGLEVEAPLAAEGLKKLAQMIYLIQNGSLNKDTILFWDEPETNLNPKYIKIVAKFLQVLAKNGVQIFVATHDYLLTYLLSLSAEYPKSETPPMRFFSLSKGENGTDIEFADTMNGFKNNSILDEYAAYSDLMLVTAMESLNEISQ